MTPPGPRATNGWRRVIVKSEAFDAGSTLSSNGAFHSSQDGQSFGHRTPACRGWSQLQGFSSDRRFRKRHPTGALPRI